MASQRTIHVLVATDGSDSAAEAARFLREFANPAAVGKITVLAVNRPIYDAEPFFGVGSISQGTWDELNTAAEKVAQDAARQTAEALAGLGTAVETVVRLGSPADEIVRAAEEVGADLIVVGSRGWGEVRAVLLGSVSERVLHSAHCPVLIVRPTAEHAETGQAGAEAAPLPR